MGSPLYDCQRIDIPHAQTEFYVDSSDKPYDVFVFRIGALALVGQKVAARRSPEVPAPRFKGCLIEPSMIRGTLDGFENCGATYRIRFHPLDENAAAAAFAAADESCELYYPLRRLRDGRETTQPPSYWDDRAAQPEILDVPEAILRDAVCDALIGHLPARATVYDPACSSGAFLAALKSRWPDIRTVGQDRSAAMVAVASQRVDEVHVGDSRHSVCPPRSVDLVICRHLNLDVVTSYQAKTLFRSAAGALRPGGLMVVIGHTPILLAGAWMEAQGFQALARCGFTPSRHATHQLYVLRASRPDLRDSFR